MTSPDSVEAAGTVNEPKASGGPLGELPFSPLEGLESSIPTLTGTVENPSPIGTMSSQPAAGSTDNVQSLAQASDISQIQPVPGSDRLAKPSEVRRIEEQLTRLSPDDLQQGSKRARHTGPSNLAQPSRQHRKSDVSLFFLGGGGYSISHTIIISEFEVDCDRRLRALETENATLRVENKALLREGQERDSQLMRQAGLIHQQAQERKKVELETFHATETSFSDESMDVDDVGCSTDGTLDRAVLEDLTLGVKGGLRKIHGMAGSRSDRDPSDDMVIDELEVRGRSMSRARHHASRSSSGPSDTGRQHTAGTSRKDKGKGKAKQNLRFGKFIPPSSTSYYKDFDRIVHVEDSDDPEESDALGRGMMLDAVELARDSFKRLTSSRLKDEDKGILGQVLAKPHRVTFHPSTSIFPDSEEEVAPGRSSLYSGRLAAQEALEPRQNREASRTADAVSSGDPSLKQILDELQKLREDNRIANQVVMNLQEEVNLLKSDRRTSRSNETPKSQPKSTGRFLLAKASTPRGDARNELHRTVRRFMNPLIGITKDKDAMRKFDISRFATEAEVSSYLNRDGDPPDLRNNILPVYWNEINSPWNHVLSKRFLALFLDKNPRFSSRKDEVISHFWKRLESFKYKYRRSMRRGDESMSEWRSRVNQDQADEHARLRKRTRRENLYKERVKTAAYRSQALPDSEQRDSWALALDVIRDLGVAGMSSDDSEGPLLDRRYVVKSKSWRSRRIEEVLKAVDHEVPTMKTSRYGNTPPGNRPRVRERPRHAAESGRTAVAHLPANYYRRTWYHALTAVEQAQLNPVSSKSLPESL
ncbi:hypothetical protein V5O48_005266 [Marasmius crinis-equi]|uniref:Uncharacterized protein n=1 Tax=Marasmius crinis-equi TaxID=585013 RepID=A0ABR3FN05_9AGAR